MAINLVFPLRAAQAVIAFVTLGLTGYVSHWWSGYWMTASPAEVNFLIFCSVWSTLALGYLVVAPLRFPFAAHHFAILAIESATTLFWFAGFVALAAFLGGRVCFGSVCSVAKAAVGMGGVAFGLFMGTTAMAARHCWRTWRNGPIAGKEHGMQAA